MSQQRMALWAAEEIDEDLQDVDLSLAVGNYGQNGMYDDGPYHFSNFRAIQ
jgi:translation initiation factor 3 subunit L